KGKPKLIIRNMPWSCRDPTKLIKIFGRFGTVVDAHIPRKRDGKLCGFAFVTMKKISNCKLALENSKDLKIDGRSVAVDFAVQKNRWEDYKSNNPRNEEQDESEEEESEEGSDDESNESEDVEMNSDEELSEEGEEESKENTQKQDRIQKNRRDDFSIFVRNVPYDATEESLAEHFSKFGPVKYALPVVDKETGLAKGTAFVAFKDEKTYTFCVNNAPAAGATSLLIDDDVLPEYVYEGRVLSVSPTLQREEANKMAEHNASKRKEVFGKAPGERDKRNLYLLNEGKVVEGSKLASLLSTKDMEIREKSYNLRVEQLKKNPSLHLSMTRLAIRNLPRAMNDKSLKALGRKGIVQFATEVKDGERHPLSKEEISRSTKEKYKFMSEEEIQREKKKDSKRGVVRQAKVIMEVKGSTIGRSRGYGFIEYRDHKSALMGLRWLNVHQVTKGEILDGLTEEEKKALDPENLKGRRLCVEFAIENANVIKRRRENVDKARNYVKRNSDEVDDSKTYDKRGDFKKRMRFDDSKTYDKRGDFKKQKRFDDSKTYDKRGDFKNQKRFEDRESAKTDDKDSKVSDDVKRLIGFKRKKKRSKK
ncbi:hypothetical protein Kpol_193p1, partial [Vanderwaltozyma polyspora DSM 70294]